MVESRREVREKVRFPETFNLLKDHLAVHDFKIASETVKEQCL